MSESDVKQILNARLARGEISEEEYDRIRVRLNADAKENIPASPSPATVSTDIVAPSVSSQINLPPSSKRFYLARLWRGELSLPTTYWLWGVGGSLVIGLICAALMNTAVTMGEAAIPAVILLIWAIFIAVAIFRSGGAYRRQYPKKRWGGVAQVMACLGLLANLGNIGKSLPGNEPDTDLDEAVVQANQTRSQMIGDNLRFDGASRQGRVFSYSFTITGPTHIPAPEDVAKARGQTIKAVCVDRATQRLLLSIDKANYRYQNEAGQNLMTYDITRGDCA